MKQNKNYSYLFILFIFFSDFINFFEFYNISFDYVKFGYGSVQLLGRMTLFSLGSPL